MFWPTNYSYIFYENFRKWFWLIRIKSQKCIKNAILFYMRVRFFGSAWHSPIFEPCEVRLMLFKSNIKRKSCFLFQFCYRKLLKLLHHLKLLFTTTMNEIRLQHTYIKEPSYASLFWVIVTLRQVMLHSII